MRLEDSSLDSLESRFSIDFQQIVIGFVIIFVITKRAIWGCDSNWTIMEGVP
jgi:hypothetical protein